MMMQNKTPLEQLGVVEELARNSAPYCEFRTHLISLREALESFAALKIEHTMFEDSTAKEIKELKEQNKKLRLRNSELNSITKPDDPESPWGEPGLKPF